ncbi:MAG: acyl carrier protein [Alphaproteobacteria bacterium]
MIEKVRAIVALYGGVSIDVASLDDAADLYAAGMTSFASVNLMLGLEEAFSIEFPDVMLTRKTFGSLAAIAEAVAKLSSNTA